MHIVAWLLTQRAVETGEIRRPRRTPPRATARPCRGQRSGSGGETAASGAAADRDEQRSLRADQAHRRGRRHRRTAGQPCARADGPPRTRPRWESRLTGAKLRGDAELHLPSRTAADRGRGQVGAIRRACSRPGRACSSPTSNWSASASPTLARKALEDSGRAVIAVRRASKPILRARPWKRRSRPAARPARTSVVGFGGGSPMDVAKLAAYLLGSGDDLDDDLGRRHRQGTAACRSSSSRPPPARAPKRRRSRSSPAKAA